MVLTSTGTIKRRHRSYFLWVFTIQTDKKLKSNRPDIMVTNFKRKTCLRIDVLAPTDNIISVQEYYKISKYKDPEIDMEKMCLKTTTAPLIVGVREWSRRGLIKTLKR